MGNFGKWHICIFLLLSLVKFPMSWNQLSVIFEAAPVSFTCSNETIDKCSNECPALVYDQSVFSETIVSTWNLVCNRAQWSNFTQMCFMFGMLLGAFIFGSLSDK